MKKRYYFLFLIVVLHGTVLFFFPHFIEKMMNQKGVVIITKQELIITTATCGVDRINETVVLLKSAIFFSKIKLRFIIFADDIANTTLSNSVASLQKMQMKDKIRQFGHDIEIRPIQFPNDEKIAWKTIFRPCATQRLFYPSLLTEFDSVLWMDSDSIFLTSPENIWYEFSQMNSSQVIAMAKEDEIPGGSYHEGYGIPYYGTTGDTHLINPSLVDVCYLLVL